MGFFATFFGMNNSDINDAPWMTLNEQIGYMCKSKLTNSYPLKEQSRLSSENNEDASKKAYN